MLGVQNSDIDTKKCLPCFQSRHLVHVTSFLLLALNTKRNKGLEQRRPNFVTKPRSYKNVVTMSY